MEISFVSPAICGFANGKFITAAAARSASCPRMKMYMSLNSIEQKKVPIPTDVCFQDVEISPKFSSRAQRYCSATKLHNYSKCYSRLT